MSSKPGTPSGMPSKSIIYSWIKQICPDIPNRFKVEDLGNGVIYCRIMNNYFPGAISQNRINFSPKNEYEYGLNLKLFQNALTQHKLNVMLDVGRISKSKFQENWGLINNLYKHLVTNNDQNVQGSNGYFGYSQNEDARSTISSSFMGGKFTPKRSFESAFGGNGYQYDHQHQRIPAEFNSSTMGSSFKQAQQQNLNSASSVTGKAQQFSQMQNNLSMYGGGKNLLNQNNIFTNAHQTSQKAPLTFHHHQSIYQQQQQSGFNSIVSLKNNDFRPTVNKSTTYEQAAKSYSVGRLYAAADSQTSQKNYEGKYSVSNHMFRNNNSYNAVIDRVKEILLKASHDIEKIRQIKMLLNIPLNDDMVKIQEEENPDIFVIKQHNGQSDSKAEAANKEKVQQSNETKQLVAADKQSLTQQLQINKEKDSKKILQDCTKSLDFKENSNKANSPPESQSGAYNSQPNKSSHCISNISSSSLSPLENPQHHHQQLSDSLSLSNKKTPSHLNPTYSSGKKIKNNFYGQGSKFRK